VARGEQQLHGLQEREGEGKTAQLLSELERGTMRDMGDTGSSVSPTRRESEGRTLQRKTGAGGGEEGKNEPGSCVCIAFWGTWADSNPDSNAACPGTAGFPLAPATTTVR
jgi:hypothetical protein